MPRDDITVLLRELREGQDGAMARLLPLVYDELRGLARHHRLSWHSPATPGTRSLVHEAYLKLATQDISSESRGQFFALASRTMRSVLIDNARRHQRQKRDGGREHVPLDAEQLVSEVRADELLALDEALSRLGEADAALAAIVECRVFGGLSVDETGEALGISPATVKRRWSLARAWLYEALARDAPGEAPADGTHTT